MHIPEVEKELILNLKIDETNPNKMTKEQIQSVANSIKKYGFLVPIIVNKDNVIIDGHQRKIAAERLDMLEVPIIRLDVDKIDAKLLKQILNKLKGTHDYEMDLEEYRVILQEQGNLDSLKDLVAYTNDDIQDILSKITPRKVYTDDELNEIPDIDDIKSTNIKKGTIIRLGKHYLMCGDSTDFAKVKEFIPGKIKLAFTSPPYNINQKMYNKYEDNLESKEYIDFNIKILSMLKELLRDDGIIGYNISYNRNSKFEYIYIIYKALHDLKLHLMETVIWKKKGMPITNDLDLTRDYEFVYVLGKEVLIHNPKELNQLAVLGNTKDIPIDKGKNKVMSNYWEIHNTNIQLKQNKACFPVELPRQAIKLFSKENDIVFDPFAGSGTTLIACEDLNRVSYNIELDEVLCESICLRFEKLTGIDRELIKE